MVNYDIIKELNDIKTRMYGSHLEQDRIVIEDAINLIEETYKNPNPKKQIPKDITPDHYYTERDTIRCPHCGATLRASVCMPGHYCYACGGKFGNKTLK